MAEDHSLHCRISDDYCSCLRVHPWLNPCKLYSSLAEAKVQEDTPAFTLLQPASVPIKKAGPNRQTTVLVFLFLAFIFITIIIIYREGHLLSLLRPSKSSDDFDEDVLFKAILKLSSVEKGEKLKSNSDE